MKSVNNTLIGLGALALAEAVQHQNTVTITAGERPPALTLHNPNGKRPRSGNPSPAKRLLERQRKSRMKDPTP